MAHTFVLVETKFPSYLISDHHPDKMFFQPLDLGHVTEHQLMERASYLLVSKSTYVTGLASCQAKIQNQFQDPRADWILKLVEQPGRSGLPASLLLQLRLPSTDTVTVWFPTVPLFLDTWPCLHPAECAAYCGKCGKVLLNLVFKITSAA